MPARDGPILIALTPLNVVPVETVEVPKFVFLTIPTVLKSFVAKILKYLHQLNLYLTLQKIHLTFDRIFTVTTLRIIITFKLHPDPLPPRLVRLTTS